MCPSSPSDGCFREFGVQPTMTMNIMAKQDGGIRIEGVGAVGVFMGVMGERLGC